jgi:hypothetical protein
MAKKKSTEESRALYEKARDLVENGMAVHEAVDKVGIHYSTYYGHRKKELNGKKVSKKTKKKVTRKNAKPSIIQVGSVPIGSVSKTMVIVMNTEDAERFLERFIAGEVG